MLPPLMTTIIDAHDECPIDFIVFSGDLVYSGSKKNAFEEACNNILWKISEQIRIPIENIIICAGNHDMAMGNEMPAITEFVDKITNNSDLDNFVQKDTKQFPHSFVNCKNFNNFIKKTYSTDSVQDLSQIFIRGKNQLKIGFVSFNSAWRSSIGNHSGKLLIPKCIIYDSLEKIKDCDLKISLIHHPLEDLKMFNKYEIEDVLFENFHINFSGHFHKKRHSIQLSSDKGMLSICSAATMSGDDDSTIGFTILDVDTETFEAKLENYTYAKNDNVFPQTSCNPVQIPVSQVKQSQIEIIKEIRKCYERTLIEADQIFVYSEIERNGKSFNELYTELKIKDKSISELHKNPKAAKLISFRDLIDKSYVIYGKEKSGKSSLLRKIQLELLKDYISNSIIPIYVDLSRGNSSFDLVSYIRSTYNFNISTTSKLISDSTLKFLIDNFNPDNRAHVEIIDLLKTISTKNTFLITSTETQTSYFDGIVVNQEKFERGFIHPISRSCIRQQTNKVLNEFSEDERQSIIDKIINIFSQLNIPFNYWSLSIFLWLYKKDKNLIFHDNVELISLYIEKMLGREDLSVKQTNIDYHLLLRFLGRLSNEMISRYQEKKYHISHVELSQFIEDFKSTNLRFVIESHDLISYLLERGVVKSSTYNLGYSFRLNGVMEYFTAIYMNENPQYVEQLIQNDNYYLEFSNEFEILAGLDKNNINLLYLIKTKTEKVLLETNNKYTIGPDKALRKNTKDSKLIAKSLSKVNLEKSQSIDLVKQDEIFDNVSPLQSFNEDVKVKIPLAIENGFSHSEIEKHLFILSRVFRSLSLIEDEKIINDTFDYILDSFINLGFDFLNDIKSLEGKPQKQIEEFIMKVFTLLMPLIVQMYISDALMQKNLARIIDLKIRKFEEDSTNNQYRLMILYFLSLDLNLDLKNLRQTVDSLIYKISIPVLLSMSLLKLHYYLLFKANGKISLQEALKEAIINIRLKIEPKSKKDEIKQAVEKDILTLGRTY